MSPTRHRIAIVGAGPGGLSAAAHAAGLGIDHVLLEASPAHAHTIQRYQKGKHVMAEPPVLPLRSELEFAAGTRETVLERWQSGITAKGVSIRYGSPVVAIEPQNPGFRLEVTGQDAITADAVVFAIGMQGNLRRLEGPGADLPCVQYQLDDPDEYHGEVIVVVGAGDAAIENAIALSAHNEVVIVNRTDEFTRVKDGNLKLITKAIDAGRIGCYYRCNVKAVEAAAGAARPYVLVLDTADGEARIACNRVIARIGATPPRRFVESCGIAFPGPDPMALPTLTARYESSVSGLYVIGALGGYPLIKQAMNQGYEVVEYILGRDIRPADHPLFEEKFRALPFGLDVDATLAFMQERVPLFREINPLQFREFILGSNVLRPAKGTPVFRRNDYTDTFFVVLDGSVDIELGDEDSYRLTMGPGHFFGEMSLLSGRRRSATVLAGPGCVLVESPRREVLKLINSVDAVRHQIDRHFVIRAIQTAFAPGAADEELEGVAAGARVNEFKTGQVIFAEGDEADTLHLIRSGSVAVSRNIGGREIVTSYVAAGNYVGEMGLMGRTRRSATVRANVATETISLDAGSFDALLARNPALRQKVQALVRKRLAENARLASQPQTGDIVSFLMQQGLGEATDVLLIDESLCIGCDNCEKACAETHGGTSRLDREAGPTFARLHVPTSCRHCEDPHCMTDCPPDAIRRAPNGEVFIRDNCIGCGNCERNCPYGVIQMAAAAAPKPGLLPWLLFGAGPGPGEDPAARGRKDSGPKKAVKCDMCKDLPGGPACVRACPTGAAIRIGPEGFIDLVRLADR
jgi:CRP-like cAMP-binding protein/Fe-S-cluster-containing hydrogenase component 2/thioredoxin reductase